jgi:hypothetical protein
MSYFQNKINQGSYTTKAKVLQGGLYCIVFAACIMAPYCLLGLSPFDV